MGARRTAIVRKMVEASVRQVDLDDLEARRARLITEIAHLEEEHRQLNRSLAEKTANVHSLANREQEVLQRLACD